MAKKPDLKRPITFFRPTDAKTIARILERARKADARESRQQSRAGRAARPSLIAQALGKALAARGRAKTGRVSIRPTAPGTGGRSFHFAHSTVTNGSRAKAGAAPRAAKASSAPARTTSAGTGKTGTGATPTTREAAHQTYIERADALAPALAAEHETTQGRANGTGLTAEAGPDVARDMGQAAGLGPQTDRGPTISAARAPTEADLSWVRERVAGQTGYGLESSAAAAQSYIENPDKARGTASSFGTIGDTPEERLAFWALVHEHESEKGGRTQSRLVLELPHEASPAARREIVRRFTQDLERDSIPYWAAIHAPTKDNDARNHHAHVVYTDRPACRMPHPETGEMVWDFTIAEAYRNATRHTRTRYPYRQNKLPAMRAINYLKVSRARFAAITNEVMKEYGCAVRYDARSYEDMDLDVAPMAHVSRIVADKMKNHDFVVMDADWTRRMIAQETEAAAQNRDVTLRRLRSIDQQLTAVAQTVASINVANKHLPAKLRLSPTSTLTRRAAAALATRMLTVERERLRERFTAEATRRTLVHIVEATAPHKTRGAAKPRVYAKNLNAPDPEILRLIHLSAIEELRLFDAWAANRRTGRTRDAKAALDAWQAQAQPTPAAPAPAAYEPLHAQPASNARTSRVPPPAPDARTPTPPMPTPAPAPTPPQVPAKPRAPPMPGAMTQTDGICSPAIRVVLRVNQDGCAGADRRLGVALP